MAIQQDNFKQQTRRTYGNTKNMPNTSRVGATTSSNMPSTPRRQLTDAEYAGRCEGNLCIKCGRGPHKLRDCQGSWIGPFEEEVKGKVATADKAAPSNSTTESEN